LVVLFGWRSGARGKRMVSEEEEEEEEERGRRAPIASAAS
jgi:hypothetical protein